ncbi:MAG: SDR family oxidoreductase [bacterium]
MSIVAITGVSSYFAQGLLPLLQGDVRIEKIVGFDIKPPRRPVAKLEFHQKDVRDPGIGALFEKADTVVHLAFIVDEPKDKSVSRSINVEGSRNVLQAIEGKPVRKILYTSSIASYGAHPDNPLDLTEDRPLRPTVDCYYSVDKVEVEKVFEEFKSRHPEILLTIFRPSLIFGPNTRNMFSQMFEFKVMPTLLGKDPPIQFLHEEDLSRALHQAIVEDHPGIFNIAGKDPVPMSRLMRAMGSRAVPLPTGLVKAAANLLFRLGKMPFSQAWVSMQEYPVTVSTARFEKEFGWAPRYSTEETFRSFLAVRGKAAA